jgi:SAM-dependent methyltransferase
MSTANSADYVVEMSEAELHRLLSIAEKGAAQVQMSCLRAGLGPGGRAIDVGCGALGALKELAEIVGSSGIVVGMDRSQESLAKAREILDRIGRSWVELLEGDANAEDLAQVSRRGPFDLAFCRLFLIHQPNPAATLRNIARLVRPGGKIIVQEPFLDGLQGVGLPPDLEVAKGLEMIAAAIRTYGGHPSVAGRMEEVASDAGLELVNQSGYFHYEPGRDAFGFGAASIRAGRRGIPTLQYPDQEIDALLEWLDLAAAADGGRYAIGFLISAEFRVPAGSL